MVHFTTERLIIRELMPEDAHAIWSFSQDPRHSKYDPDPKRTQFEFQGILEWIVQTQKDFPREYFYVGVVHKNAPQTLLGSVHITIRDSLHRQAEVGYSFHPNNWGMGYCTEATRGMVNFAFTQLEMHRVFAADIVKENVASIRVAQKLGMTQEAHHREAFFFQERWWDALTFSVLESEWQT